MPPATRTRIRPPQDVIKLEDRLYYLLQPALETVLGGQVAGVSRSIRFPTNSKGVAFLYPRVAAVLADEMGLGKTMQAITALRLLLACRRGAARACWFVPSRWSPTGGANSRNGRPNCLCWSIEGDQARRHWQWQLADVPVKIANYELLQRDRDRARCRLLEFDLVILDEAQRIKNRGSHTSQAVRAITRRRSWALTGTPVENSPEDLVGIFEFLVPGHLTSEMRPRRMGQRRRRPYVLRRTKDAVLADLPPKLFRDADVELSADQRASYRFGRERRRSAADRDGRRRDDPACLRTGAAAQADLQFRSGHRREQQARTARSRPGRSRGQRAQGDRLQPMGRHARDLGRQARRASSRWSIMGKFPPARRDGVIAEFRENRRRTSC